MPRNGLSALQSQQLTDEMERNSYRSRFRDADDPRLVPGTSFRQSDVPMTVAGISSLLPMLAPVRAARLAKGVLGFANEQTGNQIQDAAHRVANRYFAMQDPLRDGDEEAALARRTPTRRRGGPVRRARGGLAHLDQGGMPYWTNNNGVMSTTNIPFTSPTAGFSTPGQVLSGTSPGLSFLSGTGRSFTDMGGGTAGGASGPGGQSAGPSGGPGVGAAGFGNSAAAADTSAGFSNDPAAIAGNIASVISSPMGAIAALGFNAINNNNPTSLSLTNAIANAFGLGFSLPGGIEAQGVVGPGPTAALGPDAEAAAIAEGRASDLAAAIAAAPDAPGDPGGLQGQSPSTGASGTGGANGTGAGATGSSADSGGTGGDGSGGEGGGMAARGGQIKYKPVSHFRRAA